MINCLRNTKWWILSSISASSVVFLLIRRNVSNNKMIYKKLGDPPFARKIPSPSVRQDDPAVSWRTEGHFQSCSRILLKMFFFSPRNWIKNIVLILSKVLWKVFDITKTKLTSIIFVSDHQILKSLLKSILMHSKSVFESEFVLGCSFYLGALLRTRL